VIQFGIKGDDLRLTLNKRSCPRRDKGFSCKTCSNSVRSIDIATNDHLNYEILHLEFEANNQIQFAAYDHFGSVKFGDEISLDILEDLKTQGMIDSYELFDGEEL
jgi:acyl-ACP thioesterase